VQYKHPGLVQEAALLDRFPDVDIVTLVNRLVA
jgi:hypothetical protein